MYDALGCVCDTRSAEPLKTEAAVSDDGPEAIAPSHDRETRTDFRMLWLLSALHRRMKAVVLSDLYEQA